MSNKHWWQKEHPLFEQGVHLSGSLLKCVVEGRMTERDAGDLLGWIVGLNLLQYVKLEHDYLQVTAWTIWLQEKGLELGFKLTSKGVKYVTPKHSMAI